MISSLVSAEEKKFIQEGCNADIRADGRKCHDLRSFRVENAIFPHTNGSARIKIGTNTDVLCAVKVEVVEPNSSLPDQGRVEFGVDISPSCEFSGNLKRVTDYANSIAQQLDSFYISSSALDLKSLCIIPGKFCWSVFIDITVLQCDCDLLQVSTLAAYVALQSAQIPKVQLLLDERGVYSDFDISSEMAEASRLAVDNVPICVTAYQIGNAIVTDATGQEQQSASSSFRALVRTSGSLCAFEKTLTGRFTADDVLRAVTSVRMAALSIFAKTNKAIEELQILSGDAINPDAPPKRSTFFEY